MTNVPKDRGAAEDDKILSFRSQLAGARLDPKVRGFAASGAWS
jgi:hypothetical protein